MIIRDFSKLRVTEKTREDVLTHPERYTACDVRTRMEKFYTDEEYEQYINDSLSRPLLRFEEKGPSYLDKKTNKL